MSLALQQTLPGIPNDIASGPISTLRLPSDDIFIVYPSFSSVLVQSASFSLQQMLRISDVFPGSSTAPEREITACCTSSDKEGLIVASEGSRIVVWKPIIVTQKGKTSVGNQLWKIHSTLTSPRRVTSLSCQDGKLIVGSEESIAMWIWKAGDGFEVWERAWEESVSFTPTHLKLTPSGLHLAATSVGSNSVTIYPLTKEGLLSPNQQFLAPSASVSLAPANRMKRLGQRCRGQTVPFSRPIRHVVWRQSGTDKTPILYTTTVSQTSAIDTTNETFTTYIHTPVIDDPNLFQLWASVQGTQFALCGDELLRGLKTLSDQQESKGEGVIESGGWVMIREVLKDLGDLFLAQDGNELRAWSVANMSRAPPTLFKPLPILSHHVGNIFAKTTHLSLVALPPTSSSRFILLAYSPKTPLLSYEFDPVHFFSPSPPKQPTRPLFNPSFPSSILGLSQKVKQLFRTPNGRGLLSHGEDGECIAWGLSEDELWQGRSKWFSNHEEDCTPEEGDMWSIFARGRSLVHYTSSPQPRVHLRYLRVSPDNTDPSRGTMKRSPPEQLPGLLPDHRLCTLLALSDIDDGVSTPTKLPQNSYIIAATSSAFVYVWQLIGRVGARGEAPEAKLVSSYQLPVGDIDTAMVISVDPMGWHQSVINWTLKTPLQDMLVVVGGDGDISYWSPRLDYKDRDPRDPWMRTGSVKTSKKGVRMARCSARKKTAMVVPRANGTGEELSVWDSSSSEFYSGLEFVSDYQEPVNDLDWTTTADLQSVLAIGFKSRVVLLCEQRMSYMENNGSYWAPIMTIDLQQLTPDPISDSIWLANGALAIGAGNQIFVHSPLLELPKETKLNKENRKNIFELVALENGPLVDYHPQLLVQCLLWRKIELVKTILIQLDAALQDAIYDSEPSVKWQSVPTESYFTNSKNLGQDKPVPHRKTVTYGALFDDEPDVEDDSQSYSSHLVSRLISSLERPIDVQLNDHEREHLITLVQTVLEIDDQRRSLDINGLRYLISIKMFVLWRQRAPMRSGTATPVSASIITGPVLRSHSHHERLSFRNVVWAHHSESQEILLSAATAASGGKMIWKDARSLGVFLWLKSAEVIKSQMEIVARNEFMKGEDRDPTAASLFYFALGKKRLVEGLWKQSSWHPEYSVMIKFLSNDFDLPRWKTAALKNAFALLGKHRYEYAAAFFLLGGSLTDAVNVCINNLDDFQLAVAITRVMEGDDGPMLKRILEKTVIPIAFSGGHRWLGTWAFWMLKRRDLAVRILVTPLEELATNLTFPVGKIGDANNDDPSLALLFSQLKSLSLQTAKGTSEISERTEFNFVLHNARVFWRMGCHALSLDLVRSWSFQRPSVSITRESTVSTASTSNDIFALADDSLFPPTLAPTSDTRELSPHRKRSSFLLAGHNRRQSMIIDMDLSTAPPTRAASPVLNPSTTAISHSVETIKEEPQPAELARKAGLGSLMKSAKQNVQQGAMDFDMGSFGF